MKFLTPALLLIGASASLASEYDGHALVGRKLQDMGEGKKGDMEGGKKGDMNGGKKGDVDCTDGAEPIIACATVINGPGRYILTEDLVCEQTLFGILVVSDDVHIDCQGNQILGGGRLLDLVGIAISGAFHVTVSNCQISDYLVGLLALDFFPWGDVTVRDSSFTRNIIAGMGLLRLGDSPGGTFTVVDSSFNENGSRLLGAGVVTLNVDGSIISSSMDNNDGVLSAGSRCLT
jgi:hypothetical protein